MKFRYKNVEASCQAVRRRSSYLKIAVKRKPVKPVFVLAARSDEVHWISGSRATLKAMKTASEEPWQPFVYMIQQTPPDNLK
jgi:hypothetical protein